MKIIIILSIPVSILGILLGSNDPIIPILHNTWIEPFLYLLGNGNSIIFNLSCGYLTSVFLWYLLVYRPESKQRMVIKENIRQQYKSFKINTISNLLYAAGTPDTGHELIGTLCNHNRFREYFSGENKQRWHDVFNGLDENERHIHDIHIDLELLYHDVSYVLNNISFTDKESHAQFVLLQGRIFKSINHNDCHYEHVKHITTFLYMILASWSLADGKISEDIIQKMIHQI